ncbi:MAG: hypothetical protein MR658_03005 [Campylobacter sp.]|uniref:hypothetical protein n=1 Tax=Campylobacter sp. TaxID=205 RepID=UPI002A52641B|nr:hypothetical protein [Campylobacter sp.]MDD7090338.1 hypothetical protein [Campylobacteraceae bacterium]MCI6177782.1 hypothetical protein [Campylobacter sp.]MDY3246599.1 hypothetical protein [Campylobacter sp.]MDY5285950.1 hypothetical protein [Campylobacter sp.]MDY5385156.1 hypothetical protein [Campylobacter sp.]
MKEVKKLKLQIGENEYIFGDFPLKSELDEFDTQAYKQELNAIADEVKSKMAIFDGLSELDLGELKAELKAEILAELKAELKDVSA